MAARSLASEELSVEGCGCLGQSITGCYESSSGSGGCTEHEIAAVQK